MIFSENFDTLDMEKRQQLFEKVYENEPKQHAKNIKYQSDMEKTRNSNFVKLNRKNKVKFNLTPRSSHAEIFYFAPLKRSFF